MTQQGAVHIGTSGWHYDHWAGPFYPTDLPAEEYLPFYARRYQSVEINNSFYQLPDTKTLETWRDTVPEEFTFAVKASRYITHMKKLKDPREPVGNFLDRISILNDRLGPILFQLPPNWRPNVERLHSFLQVLPEGRRYTFEFRDQRWFDPRVYEILRGNGAAFCIYQLAGTQSPRQVTADFVYIRLHGPDEEAYQGKYTPQALSGWAGAISTWSRQGKDVFCYFDNDEQGFAPQNAARLQEMLSAG